MMNLDVSVRLLDGLTRPAANVDRALTGIGRSAAGLVSHFTRLTGSVRGLTTATRELASAEATLGRATASGGRLRGTMAGIGPAARASSPGLNIASRAMDKLGSSASKAANATSRLHGALGTAAPAAGFVASATTQLAQLAALQRQAIANMRTLNGGGGTGRGGRRGMGGSARHGGGALPGVMAAFQPSGHEALRSTYTQATSLQDAIVKMHLNGLSDSEIASVRAKSDEVEKLNKSTTPLANMNAIMQARLALGGDLSEALATAGEMSKMRTILGFSLGKDRAKAAEDATYDMLRTAEVRNVVNDPARRESLFKGMTAATIASNGRITPKMWHSTAVYGRSATQGLSDEFENFRLPFLMQEMQVGGKGGPAGVALQSMFRAIPMAIQKASNIGAWRSIGMLNENKIEHSRMGDRMLPGAIQHDKLAISDPDKFVYEVMDRLAKRDHLTDISGKDRGAMIQALAQFFGTATAQSAVDIMGLQRGRMDNFERTLRQVEDGTTIVEQINLTASQNVEMLDAGMKTLSGNIGSLVIPAFTSLVEGTNRPVGTMNAVAVVGGKNGNDPVKGTGGMSLSQAAVVGGGLAYGLGALASRFPLLARIMAGAAGTAATGSPYGALLGPTLLAGATRFLGMLPGAVRTGLTAGLRGGLIAGLAYEGGKALIEGALSFIPKPKLAPEKQRAFDANRREWDNAYVWQKPGLILRDMVGGRAGDDMPTIAGARAAGGPVRGRLTYLVGERGPELFTPGMSGGITSNSNTNRFLGAGGDTQDPAGALVRELRMMAFGIVSALAEIGRRLSRRRDDAGNGGNGFYAGNAAPGGGTEGGGRSFGGGGRRGFMEAGSGAPAARGRRGFMTRGTPAAGGDPVVDGSSVDVATDLLKKREGFQANAKWDRNHLRLGYGLDTITGADGKVREVQAGDHVSKQDAVRDLVRRIPEFQRKVAREVGVDNWNKLNPTVQGVLTSTAYNYGGFSKRASLRTAIATGDNAKIAAAVSAMHGDNGGIDAGRRDEESDMIAHAGQGREAPSATFARGQMDSRALTGQLRSLRRANEQCVSLATASVGLTAGMKGANVHEWLKGEGAEAGNLKPGTPIATFLDRAGRQISRYAGGGSGTMGAGLDHAAVFEKYLTNKAGEKIGMQVAEQYKGSHGVHEKNYMFRNGRWGEHNGSNYNAIKGPDGSYLGGSQNPMNARVPEVLQAQAKAQREQVRAQKDQLSGNDTHHHYHGDIATNVYAQPHHDARQIAALVHRKFDDATRAQLSDGAFS